MWVKIFRCFHCKKEGKDLITCSVCEEAYYCDSACEQRHAKAHQRVCSAAVAAKARDAKRARVARAVREARRSGNKGKVEGEEGDALCAICQYPPVDPVEQPCGHEFCKSCLAELKEKGVVQTCPVCRDPLPPGPDKLFDMGSRLMEKVRVKVVRREVS